MTLTDPRPFMREIRAVETLGRELFRDDDLWIACLLRASSQLARATGQEGLTRVLVAFAIAHEQGSLPELLRRKRNLSLLRQSDLFLEGVGPSKNDAKAGAVTRLLIRLLDNANDRLKVAMIVAMRALVSALALVNAPTDHKRNTESSTLNAHTDLIRLMNALVEAHEKGRLPELLAEKRNTTAVGHADTVLGPDSVLGGPRRNWARRIAQVFEGEMDEAEVAERARAVAFWFGNSRAELSLGTPQHRVGQPEWHERIVSECVKLRMTKAPMDRQPYHYARAVLRAWGLTSAEADDVVSPVEREALG